MIEKLILQLLHIMMMTILAVMSMYYLQGLKLKSSFLIASVFVVNFLMIMNNRFPIIKISV
ncbi:hypothetical protein ABR33_00425 [Enterobacter bugandensis]|nr:hypothetical protein ABR33_00425 [Enterobacter bugandensis]